MLFRISANGSQQLTGKSEWGYIAGLLTGETSEVAIMGPGALEQNSAMQKKFLPDCTFMGGIKENLPLLENKLPDTGTLIYVCRRKVCKRPVENVKAAWQLLQQGKKI
jgi:uncharacterized protein YyaL (SSP411 family)